jgi:hypothetical protein
VAGTAPGLAAGGARSLSAQVGKMETVVADQARALQPEAPLAGWRLHLASRGMPVDGHDALALASFDQHLVAMHRGVPLIRYRLRGLGLSVMGAATRKSS